MATGSMDKTFLDLYFSFYILLTAYHIRTTSKLTIVNTTANIMYSMCIEIQSSKFKGLILDKRTEGRPIKQ